jgi:hypothetical protein
VIIDDGLSRQLKPISFQYAWDAIEDIAGTRGLPVSWPDLDEEERQLLDMSLVWGGFTDYLVERGAPADGVAIMAARREGPQWTVRWNLASESQTWSWQNNDIELMYALAEGVHRMADQIAASNAIGAEEQGIWSIEVSIGALDSGGDYAKCLEYLQGLSLVNLVEVTGAAPGLVHFRLQLNASTDHLAETFRQGLVLIPASAGSEYDYVFLH